MRWIQVAIEHYNVDSSATIDNVLGVLFPNLMLFRVDRSANLDVAIYHS
jgi:hypothetical protein